MFFYTKCCAREQHTSKAEGVSARPHSVGNRKLSGARVSIARLVVASASAHAVNSRLSTGGFSVSRLNCARVKKQSLVKRVQRRASLVAAPGPATSFTVDSSGKFKRLLSDSINSVGVFNVPFHARKQHLLTA